METTKVVIAQSKSKSLRTTIPAGIARQFGIMEGSDLAWEIRARENQLIIEVRPLKPDPLTEEPTVAAKAERAGPRKKPIAKGD